MTQKIDREGTFQGLILEYGLREEKSGSLAVTVRARLDRIWDSETEIWQDWQEYEMEADGFLYIIKKNGEPNNGQIESLVKFAGWDGTIASISESTWHPTPCQFSIEANEYQGKTTYRIAYINENNRIPGQLGNVSADKLKALEVKYGASLRAIAGSARMNAKPAADAKMPTPKNSAPAKPAEPELAAAATTGNEIPF